MLDEARDVLVCGGRQVDRVALLPDTQPSRACLGCQFLSSPKGRHWVEGVERQPRLLSLTGNDIAAGARGAQQDVLVVCLLEVDDVPLVPTAGALDVSQDGQEADLHSFSCCLQYGPDSAEALFEDSFRRYLQASRYVVLARF